MCLPALVSITIYYYYYYFIPHIYTINANFQQQKQKQNHIYTHKFYSEADNRTDDSIHLLTFW